MKRSYVVASCSACDKRGKARKAEGWKKKSLQYTGSSQDRAIVVQRTTLLSVCKSTVYGGRATEDRSNADARFRESRVARNRLHGIRPIRCDV